MCECVRLSHCFSTFFRAGRPRHGNAISAYPIQSRRRVAETGGVAHPSIGHSKEARMSVGLRRRNEDRDALDLLHEEHVALLAAFERLRTGAAGSRALSKTLTTACQTLLRHGQIEQELFYPVLRGLSGLDDLLDAARVEHRTMRELIFEVLNGRPRNGLRAARIEALAMYVAHHFREEEENFFPRARAASIDLAALGRRIVERRAELEADRQPAGCEANA